jgi:hypothetical protein
LGGIFLLDEFLLIPLFPKRKGGIGMKLAASETAIPRAAIHKGN